MNRIVKNFLTRFLPLLLLAGCTLLPQPDPAPQDRYLLEYAPASARTPASPVPVLMVIMPEAHGAYDSSRIAYMKQQYGLRYYMNSRWADTPAHMLAPLIADAVNARGQMQALTAMPGSIAANLRLDSELVRFHQDFTVQPSEMHVTLSVRLVSLRDQKVIAARVFDVREAATSEDAYGGVQAANRAVAKVLDQLAEFCDEQAVAQH